MPCKVCQQPLAPPSSEESGFFERISFTFAGKNFPFPPPALCPECRHQRRLAFRNERSLYYRPSSTSGERILSLYHPTPLWGGPYTVMLEDEWRGDSFDPLSYGRLVDFNRPFFDQYAELHKAVPRMSIVNIGNENSPYTSHTGYSKSCYLLPCSEHCEECYYGRFLQKCKSCVDCTSAHRSELCYECFQIADCYHCAFLSLSENCHDCFFSEDLIGCHHCLFSSNLRRGEYRIFNSPVTPEEFETTVRQLMSSASAIAGALQEWERVRIGRARRPANIRNCENSSGDFLRDSKSCTNCLDVTGCEDCSDVIIGYNLRDCRSCSNFYLQSELNYEILGSTELYHCAFNFYAFRSHDVLYSEYIYDSNHLFGCVGMTRQQHCILNRQYSPTDYQMLAARLARHMRDTGEWGAQLPAGFSPFGYNETVASDMFPLTKDAARERGFLWRDVDEKERISVTVENPPDGIEACDRSLAKEIFRCELTGEPFRLIGPEIDFCVDNGFALPRASPRARHQRRELLRFPARFRRGLCVECRDPLLTNVPPELDATVYCERCFQRLF